MNNVCNLYSYLLLVFMKPTKCNYDLIFMVDPILLGTRVTGMLSEISGDVTCLLVYGNRLYVCNEDMYVYNEVMPFKSRRNDKIWQTKSKLWLTRHSNTVKTPCEQKTCHHTQLQHLNVLSRCLQSKQYPWDAIWKAYTYPEQHVTKMVIPARHTVAERISISWKNPNPTNSQTIWGHPCYTMNVIFSVNLL